MKDTGLRFPTPGSGPPIARGRLAMWLLLVVETMFFVGMLGAYSIVRVRATEWPEPYAIATTVRDATGAFAREVLRPPRLEMTLPLINAVVLSIAAIAAVLAGRAARRGEAGRVKGLLWATAVAGAGFIVGVLLEVDHEAARGLTLHSGNYGSMVFLITGAHAAHVVAGLIWHFAVLVPAMARPGRLSAARIEYLGLYWGFVAVLWWALFGILSA